MYKYIIFTSKFQEKEKSKHKAQNVISSALKSNSSLRAHPNFKVFKKVNYKILLGYFLFRNV